MTVRQLINELSRFEDYDIVVCVDDEGGWDNIQKTHRSGSVVSIRFGGGSPFSDE